MKIQLLITFFCSYFGRISRSHSPLIDQRIVGGIPTDVRQFPYQLSLEHRFESGFLHWCGASVISKRWALTAAHCVYKFQTAKFRIRAATSIIQKGGTIYMVEGIVHHPNYEPLNQDYDIALIKLSKPGFNYSDVLKPVHLARNTPPKDTIVVVSGWGAVQTDGGLVAQLRQVTVKVIDHETCVAAYKKNEDIVTSRMICAGFTKGAKRDACGGDSGGPLVLEGLIQVGIVSSGLDCGDRLFPGIYTDVAYLRKWIQKITGIS